MNNLGLLELRKHAADASGGRSSEPIYEVALRVSVEHELSGHALDFGSGKGKFLKKLHSLNQFQNLSAIDLMPKADNIPADVEWICADLNNPYVIPSRTYDVIFALEVIEHLENPRLTIRTMFSALNNGGTLILTTPNSENIRGFVSLLFKRHFWAFTETSYPAHITALLETDLRRIGEECGFEDIHFDYSVPGRIPKLPKVTWQTVSFGLFKGRLFCDNLLMIAKKAK